MAVEPPSVPRPREIRIKNQVLVFSSSQFFMVVVQKLFYSLLQSLQLEVHTAKRKNAKKVGRHKTPFVTPNLKGYHYAHFGGRSFQFSWVNTHTYTWKFMVLFPLLFF